MLGCRGEDQHGAPLALRVRHYVIEPLPDRFGASQIMVLVEQLVAAFQLARLSCPYLQTLKDCLLLGIGFANAFAHGPELEKSRDRCPAKTSYVLLLNDLWSEVNLRWHLSNPPCDNPVMKKESEPQNQVEVAGPNPAPDDLSMSQKITSPNSRSQSTIQFQEIPIGHHFEFRGHRCRKLALSMASDEDRYGTIFMAETEVLQDPLLMTSR